MLASVPDHGLAVAKTACDEALEAGTASVDVVLTVLARRPGEIQHAVARAGPLTRHPPRNFPHRVGCRGCPQLTFKGGRFCVPLVD